ncbi:DNA polymerase III subunit gamma and tau [Micromonospora sp. WP24]|uniref:DNA polymerase III subunit gamma and tau n=1 Tax=Micromonospora sp. WP24 TaxID=2604469 RepID=UPI0011DB5D1D|nr:DNA polymerase III subunit gamma and tau [Micromonospora sp. WP24]TYB93798.1 DNA polymerase III subunit gamma and tau [Micromonospora sp. WP24]
MALALYRKYRPRTFAEVIGQEHVTEPLSQALRSGRLNHAYLFSGPRGCGKTSSARILARSLNCEQGPTPEPCGQCESCRSLANDGAGSIDVIEIDAASHGGVDDARELREKAVFAPARSRFKIYVIDEAHMVSSAGFNALLKLVEEPPEYVKFIFATTEPEKVLGTIKSRTHHYPFRLMPPKVLRPYLEQLTEAEGISVEPAVFPLVVRAGGGSARDSLSVLDQLIAGAGAEGVTYAQAAALLGVTDSALIDEMCDALAAGDGAAAYATVDQVAEAGHDPRRFASDLLERLRDLIVLQQVPDAAAKGLIDGPADQIERMTAQAQQLGPGTLSRCADIVHNGLVEMRGATAPRLLLELICARMLLPGADDSTAGLLQRLERMERRLTLGGADAAGSAPVAPAPAVRPTPSAPPAAAAAASADPATAAAATPAPAPAAAHVPDAGAPRPHSSAEAGPTAQPAATARADDAPRRVVPPSAVLPDPVTPEPPRPGAATPGVLDAVAVRRVWPDVVGKVNRTNKRIAALMRDAVVRELDGDTLVLTVKSGVLARMMSDHAAVLTDALYEELGGRWQIRCEVAGERGGVTLSGPPRSAAPAPAPAPATNGVTGSAPAAHGVTGSAAGRAGGGAPGPAVDGVAAGDDEEDWPEPARPGGAAPVSAGGSAPAGDAGDDWPEPARPGGARAADQAGPVDGDQPGQRAGEPGSAEVSGSASAPATRGAAPANTGGSAAPRQPVAQNGNGAPVSSAIAAARAAAAGRGPRTAQPARPTADNDWAGEPPYDPEYDGPVRSGDGRPQAAPATPVYDGFDPGDEPLDDVMDEKTARESSEEQAVRLLREAFGAEKINEVDAR